MPTEPSGGAGYLHSGPDCRLYISPGSTTFYIQVVHQPDLKFPDCQFEVKAIKTPTNLAFNLPNLPMYRFGGACDGSIGWGIVGTGEAGVEQVPLHVFPNPANEYATVRLPEGHGWSALVVYDVLGREVLRTALAPGANSMEFNTGLLVSGLYLIAPLGEKELALKLLVRH